jgi:hypothetical protein
VRTLGLCLVSLAAMSAVIASSASAASLSSAFGSAGLANLKVGPATGAIGAKAVPLRKRCGWSRAHHRGARTCRYYHGKKLVKICVTKPKHRERCKIVHSSPTGPAANNGTPPPASSGAIQVPVGAVTPPAGTSPTPGAGEQLATSTGTLLPVEQIEPAPGATDAALPTSIDLSGDSVPVGYQGSIGSCVTWAIDYAMLGWYSRHENRAGQPFNPMYTYSQVHLDNSAEGGGSYPKDALNVALQQGNDTMAHYSVKSTTDFTDKPTVADQTSAANYKISGWRALFQSTSGVGSAIDAATLRAALAQGKPVAIGMEVRAPFQKLWGASSSYVWDDVTSQFIGRHEVMATGYDAAGLWIQNSWSAQWGYNGYMHLSWQVVEHDVFEAETISGFTPTQTGDTTPPQMGSVTARLYEHQITYTAAPVRLAWSATDNTGVTAYAVAVTADNGQTWASDTYSPADATSIDRLLAFGTTYQYAVAARDAAGNWSEWAYSRPTTATVRDDTAYAEEGFWTRYALSEALGGTYLASESPGAWITRSFTGTSVSWIAPKFSSGGRAKVYCDGTYVGTADLLSSSTVARETVGWCNFGESASHTMKVEGEGTASRPWTAIDAFVTLS